MTEGMARGGRRLWGFARFLANPLATISIFRELNSQRKHQNQRLNSHAYAPNRGQLKVW